MTKGAWGKRWHMVGTIIMYIVLTSSHAFTAPIIITTDVTGDYTASSSDEYILESTVTGKFNFTAFQGSLYLRSSGKILQSLHISNNGPIQVMLEAGSRIGQGIRETGGATTLFTIYGTVDDGIEISANGNTTITVSGLLAEVGLITNEKISIKGSTNNSGKFFIEDGATVNGSISLGNRGDIVTVKNSSIGGIIGSGGDKVITIVDGATVKGDIDLKQNNVSGNASLLIQDSTISGKINIEGNNNPQQNNDRVDITNSTIISDLLLGYGNDSLTLLESSNVNGNIISKGNLELISTFGSSIAQALQVTGSLYLTAESGIVIRGEVSSGPNSVYTVRRSIFSATVNLRGTTKMEAVESEFSNNITLTQQGDLFITFHKSKGNNIIATSNTQGKTEIALHNNSRINSISLGSSLNKLVMRDSRINEIHAHNITIDAISSTLTGTLSIQERFEGHFISSVVDKEITTSNGQFQTNLIAEDSLFKGPITLNGTTKLNLNTSQVLGDIKIGSQTSTVDINRTTFNNFESGNATNTINITSSTMKNLSLQLGDNTSLLDATTVENITLGTGKNKLTLRNTSFFTITSGNTTIGETEVLVQGNSTLMGSTIDMKTQGNLTLQGSLYFANNGKQSNQNIDKITNSLHGNSLTIEEGGYITVLGQPAGSYSSLYFNKVINNSTKPIINLHVNTFYGIKSTLDISNIKQIENQPFLVHFLGGHGKGAPLAKLESVIISSQNITPVTAHEYVLLNGNLYTLDPNEHKANHYDLTYRGISPTNYGYAASHNAIRNFNTLVWHNIISHFQEEGSMFRNKDGQQREGSHIVNAISTWAKVGYSSFTIKPSFDIPRLFQSSVSLLAGVDFANISINKHTTMMFQFFAGVGGTQSKFKEIEPQSISLSATHFGGTAGVSVGFQNLTHQGKGKIYNITTLWYSMMNHNLKSNLFIEDSTWGNQSINLSHSLGYSIYLQQILITPQIDIAYFHTAKKEYTTPDLANIYFEEENRVIGRASLLLGYAFSTGFTPYLRGGIEVPLFRGKGSGDIHIDYSAHPYSYDTVSFTSEATVGIAYRGGFKHFSFTFSAEASAFFGSKQGIEAFVQAGFQF